MVQSKRQLDALLHYSNRDELFATSGRDSPASGGGGERKTNNQRYEIRLELSTFSFKLETDTRRIDRTAVMML